MGAAMIGAMASTRATLRDRGARLEGERIAVSPLEVLGWAAGSLNSNDTTSAVDSNRHQQRQLLDNVDRSAPTNYLLLSRSGPSGRPGCVRPHGSRRRYETTSLHHRCPPGGVLDGAALSATAHRHDPRTRHRRCDPARSEEHTSELQSPYD